MAGVAVPLHAAEHFYIVTEPGAGLPRDLPVLRVPDECIYVKEDAGKLLVGCLRAGGQALGHEGHPGGLLLRHPARRHGPFRAACWSALHRMPALAKVGMQTWFNGPESFTPDDRYLLGETAECATSSSPAASTRSASRAPAAPARCWPTGSATATRRWTCGTSTCAACMPFQATRSYLHDRTTETLGLLYAMHWPFRQARERARRAASPLHDRLAAAGACMGETRRLGARQLVRAQGGRSRSTSTLGAAELVRHRRRKCTGRARPAWRCSTSPPSPSTWCRAADA
jgi:hypothetical protein